MNRTKTNAFLMVWSPRSWPWETFDQDYKKFKANGTHTEQWGCGKRLDIKAGDRIYFIKLGDHGVRGIIGSGVAGTDTFQDKHWNGEPGKIGNFIEIVFDMLLHPELDKDRVIFIETLDAAILPERQEWHPQQSGIEIKPAALEFLDSIWLKTKTEALEREYREGKVRVSTVRKYERDSEARRVAIQTHGCKCGICDFDFQKMYGDLGEGFIHVHHIHPVHERNGIEYKVDPLKDLIPVCPNCHAMIHLGGENRSIEEIKSIISKNCE